MRMPRSNIRISSDRVVLQKHPITGDRIVTHLLRGRPSKCSFFIGKRLLSLKTFNLKGARVVSGMTSKLNTTMYFSMLKSMFDIKICGINAAELKPRVGVKHGNIGLTTL